MSDCRFIQNTKTPEVCSKLIQYVDNVGGVFQFFCQRQCFFVIFQGCLEIRGLAIYLAKFSLGYHFPHIIIIGLVAG